MSSRRKFIHTPAREAMPEAIWVYPASSPTEAPNPFDTKVWRESSTLSLNDMRPPCRALASIGSTTSPRPIRRQYQPIAARIAPPAAGQASDQGVVRREE